MRVKIFLGVLLLAAVYGGLLFVERLTTQELTRVPHPTTQEVVCLIWKPRLLQGGGVCYVDLLNAEGKVLDTAKLGALDASFEALQQYGQLEFQGQEITVKNLRTGELVQRFMVRDGRLSRPD